MPELAYCWVLIINAEIDNDWNYGKAVQDMKVNVIEEVKKYLREAGKSPGSLQMDSFGPNMILVQELLKIGQKEIVMEFFGSYAKFWKMDHGKLKQWEAQVEKGEIPDFVTNIFC